LARAIKVGLGVGADINNSTEEMLTPNTALASENGQMSAA
jgi:hypothetical protein